MPPESAFRWADGYAAALRGTPELRARWTGTEEADWEAYVIRRRLLEAREAAKIFAAAPGVRRLYDPMFEASFGVSSAGLAAAFEKEEAAMARILSGARKSTPTVGAKWNQLLRRRIRVRVFSGVFHRRFIGLRGWHVVKTCVQFSCFETRTFFAELR